MTAEDQAAYAEVRDLLTERAEALAGRPLARIFEVTAYELGRVVEEGWLDGVRPSVESV